MIKSAVLETGKISINRSKGKSSKKFKKYFPYILMCLPALIYFLINNYLPICGLFIAFKNINTSIGFFKSPWCGFQNFKFLFATTDAFIITRNTIGYNFTFIIVNTVISVVVALLLNEIKRRAFLRSYQSIILLPYLISMVIVAYIVYAFLSTDTGILNKTILPLFGIKAVGWYQEPQYWPFILVTVNLWKNIGFLTVIYYSSVIGISEDYYEAAKLDGASRWQQIKNITLPLIKPTIITMVLLAIGRIFYADFGLFYQVPMNSGMIYPTTNVIDTYVYRALLQTGDIGMSSAAGAYQSFVGFVVVMLSNLAVKKIDPDNALF
jgi:putative aldouronate transport system permease protein